MNNRNARGTRRAVLCVFVIIAVACVVMPACGERPRGAKNVILFIGDGMGPQAMGLAMMYARNAPHSTVPGRRLNLEKLLNEGVTGVALTHPAGFIVADSSSSATQIATGKKSLPGYVGLDAEGNAVETILEKAKRHGKSTGLVSDTRITHATPASFAAHIRSRGMEAAIADDLLRTQPDVMLSGGLRYWLPADVNDSRSTAYAAVREILPSGFEIRSGRTDSHDCVESARKLGYAVAFTRDDMNRGAPERLLGLFAPSELPDAITVRKTMSDPGRRIPTLSEMARRAIELLSVSEEGFFLMVEAGQIDWAAHCNDAGRLLHEMLVFDDTLGRLLEWVSRRNDTLLIVMSDHETGGFGFSYSTCDSPGKKSADGAYSPKWNYGRYEVLDKLYAQSSSLYELLLRFHGLPARERTAERFMNSFNSSVRFPINLHQARRIIGDEPGACRDVAGTARIGGFDEFYTNSLDAQCALIARAIAGRQGVVWGSGTHTSTPVLVVAYGPHELTRAFRGVHHTTDIHRLINEAMDW